ncbi:hypothetical protein [Candidatus Thiodictyon syntrophicum]|jgi:hypothetical protein|uniref:Uncharacterized protein n=1 Tax=Candidatus Thiodictyon syntrophicum TaxID=1166950 RepID=A0A2K8UB31_9GAMM|nr:hypothetical protein [Candidatus Thiodictyon syntrophicum]AUB82747.1 hypothetical protein THSYN_18590 [Candidatus Thiodictyon syntrophicum]
MYTLNPFGDDPVLDGWFPKNSSPPSQVIGGTGSCLAVSALPVGSAGEEWLVFFTRGEDGALNVRYTKDFSMTLIDVPEAAFQSPRGWVTQCATIPIVTDSGPAILVALATHQGYLTMQTLYQNDHGKLTWAQQPHVPLRVHPQTEIALVAGSIESRNNARTEQGRRTVQLFLSDASNLAADVRRGEWQLVGRYGEGQFTDWVTGGTAKTAAPTRTVSGAPCFPRTLAGSTRRVPSPPSPAMRRTRRATCGNTLPSPAAPRRDYSIRGC